MDTKAPAASRYQSEPRVPASSATRTVSGTTSGAPPAKVRATRRSFHTQRNWKTPNAAIAGVSSGRSTWKKILTCPAPSMRAASTRGRDLLHEVVQQEDGQGQP